MKNISLSLILVLVSTLLFGQKALQFSQAKEEGINTTYLDSIYASGIHSDTSLAVFKTNQEKYTGAYQELLQELGRYLKSQGFEWEKATRGFNRIYFEKGGRIDYFLYQFRAGQLTAEQEQRFDELLKAFIQDYRFPLSAPVNFAQCSPVTYLPVK